MSEPKVAVKEEVKEEVVEDEVVETLSPLEEQAVGQGWVPKEEWVKNGGNEDEWRSAKEFIDRGELYKSIHSLRKDQKHLQAAHTALQRHHNYVFEKAYQKAFNDLRAEKRAAMKDQDLEAVDQIEERIEELQEEFTKEKKAVDTQQQAQQQAVEENPVFNSWMDRNRWFKDSAEMRTFAEAYGISYAKNYPGTDPVTILSRVETEVKKKFPEKFGARKAAPNAVAGVNRTGRPSTKNTEIELDDMERDIMRGLVESGEMTEAEYRAELKKVKGL